MLRRNYCCHEAEWRRDFGPVIHIFREFWRGLRAWERPARLALMLGLAACIPLLWLWLAGPPQWRRPALAGLCGLGVGMQMVFLWAWRGMLSDWTRAQRLYLAGEFEAACDILQARRAAGRADMRSLTLLGNALRQRGMLESSEAVLREALGQRPDHAFPLTGLGRTQLAQGQFEQAAATFQQALDAGAPDIVQLDYGEALVYAGRREIASDPLQAGINAANDPGRVLVGCQLLYGLGKSSSPSAELVEAGRPWLVAQTGRFAHTPYGRELQALLVAIDRIVDDSPC